MQAHHNEPFICCKKRQGKWRDHLSERKINLIFAPDLYLYIMSYLIKVF